MRDIIPYIFYPWLLISCTVLLRRRIGGGSWKTKPAAEVPPPIEFAPPPTSRPHAEAQGNVAVESQPEPTPIATIPIDRPRSRSLAEALEGIAMPCDLAPLMGTGPLDARQVTFFTNGHEPAAVGSALSDELERLGFAITPDNDRAIRAERGDDLVRAKMASATLDSEAVMTELHPSAPEGSLVVELKLV